MANIQVPMYEAFDQLELLPWVTLGVALANAAITPLVRQLMALFDLKWFYGSSLIFVAVSGAVAGSAQNMQAVIAGRILMGVGVSGAYLGFVGGSTSSPAYPEANKPP
jgi:MFS family permease